MKQRVLDWVSQHDPESLDYPIRATFGPREQPINITWRTPLPLDQGYEGACVGFAWTGEALTTPVAVDLTRVDGSLTEEPNDFARLLYRDAQRLDEWAGENYEGTSVLAGAKVMKNLGLLREYRWAFGTRDIALALSTTGPVVLGIPWLSGMYEAPKGILAPGGDVVGGHAILAHAYRTPGRIFETEAAFGLLNSWGPYWGNGGKAWIRESHLAELLADQGEACVPVRRSYGR